VTLLPATSQQEYAPWGSRDGVARTALTVDCHALGLVARLAQEHQFGPWFTRSDQEQQRLGRPWGPANPQALNRYSYVQNNPLRYTDPTGHRVKPPLCLICGLAIDISQWAEPAKVAAAVGCWVLGCRIEQDVITGPTYEDWLQAQTASLVPMPLATVGTRFEKAGIKVTGHFLHQLRIRQARGVTEEAALRAYRRGRLFYNPATKNYIRHDSQTGISVVVDRPSGGKAITVFEGNPSLDWIPVPWRPGSS
jgi:hypothetical protein